MSKTLISDEFFYETAGHFTFPMSKKSKKASPASAVPTPPYQLYVEALYGTDIPAVDRGGTSDPYIAIQLVGNDLRLISRFVENSLNPVWNHRIGPLRGFSVGNDLLRIQVVDKDRVQGSPDDDIIGQVDVPVREIPLGFVVERTFALLKCDSKGKVEKKAKPGSGGTVALKINAVWPGQEPWDDSPWGWPLYTAVVEFSSAANLPAADAGGKSDPYVVAKVLPAWNSQKTKTKTQDKTLDPVWNEQKTFLLGSGPDDKLQVLIYDHDSVGDDDKIASTDIPFGDFDFNVLEEWQPKTYLLKPSSGKKKAEGPPTLTVRVKLTCNNEGGVPLAKGLIAGAFTPLPAPTQPQEGTVIDCKFQWESFTSSYSTSLSGYTNYEKGTISDLHPGEDEQHNHPPIVKKEKPPDEEQPPKPPGPLVLSGVVVGARGLPKADSDGTDSYVVVNVGNKSGKEKRRTQSEIVHDTSDPDWNYPFDAGEVRKGQAIEFTVFQNHKIFAEQPIAYAKYEVKNIELDNPNIVEIALGKPEKFTKLKWKFLGWGTLLVVFNLTVKPA
jgi:hypothetical protein